MTSRMLLASVCLLTALPFTGCIYEECSGCDDSYSDCVGPGCDCYDDTECAAEHVCDASRGACIPQEDRRCWSDYDCRAGSTCDSDSGLCSDAGGAQECQRSSDCGASELCLYGVCLPGGASPDPDPEPGDRAACVFNDDCSAGLLCVDGSCRATCQSDAGCSSEDSCQGGLCLPRPPRVVECGRNADCGAEQLCVDARCVTPCRASCECSVGDWCGDGFCQAPPEERLTCSADCDCPSGGSCGLDGFCD